MTNMKHLRTATVSGGAEVNRAIGTLVSAFEIDPVARWMYPALDQYLLHIPRLFRALGASSFEVGAAHRSPTEPGSRFGFLRVCTAIAHPLKRSLQIA
jgi:hypothetical protein